MTCINQVLPPKKEYNLTSERNIPCESNSCLFVDWDSEIAAILLLLHLLPPTFKGKKSSKISALDAAGRLVKFMKVCC